MKNKSRIFKRIVMIIAEILLGVSLIVLAYYVNGIWYETNDDHILSDFLTGKLTGVPTIRTFYNSVLFAGPVALAYKVLPSFPWYGAFLIFFHLISWVLPQAGSVTAEFNIHLQRHYLP